MFCHFWGPLDGVHILIRLVDNMNINIRAGNLIVIFSSLTVGETDLIRELSNLTADYNLQSAEVSVSTDKNLDWISW